MSDENAVYDLPRSILKLAYECMDVSCSQDASVLLAVKKIIGSEDDELAIRFISLIRRAIANTKRMVEESNTIAQRDINHFAKSLNDFSDLFWFDKISQKWTGNRDRYLSAENIAHLRGVAFSFGHASRSYMLSPEIHPEIDSLLNKLEKLAESEAIDPLVKSSLCQEIEFLRISIRKFNIFGMQALEESFGRFALHCLKLFNESKIKKNILRIVVLLAGAIIFFGDLSGGVEQISKTVELIEKHINDQ